MNLADLPVWGDILVVGGLFLLLLASGMWIGIAMGAVGLFILVFMAQGAQGMTGLIMFNSTNSFVLVAVPLFVFMGEIVLRSGLGARLYEGASRLTSIIPGGLTHSNIVACSIFAAVSGSSLATSATISTVAIPEQEARGYDRRLIKGSLAAGGTLGILIPPSVVMIIYGAFVGVSVARLFLGGFIPGIILAGMFMAYILIASIVRPQWSPERVKLTWAYIPRALSAFKEIWPMLVLMAIIMGGIYSGIVTPTEAAAVSVFVAAILAAALRKLNFQIIKEAVVSSLSITGMILIIVVGAAIMGTGLSLIKLPANLSAFALGFDLSPMTLWFLIILVYLVLGCFLEIFSLMLLTLPVTFFILVEQLGFDPVWFGVQLTILVECALITPPVGTNLYVIHGIAGGKRLEEVIIGVIPFFLLMVVAITLFSFFPWLITWLPDTLFGML